MSKAFLTSAIKQSTGLNERASRKAAGDLIAAIVREIKKEVTFGLHSFGTFTVAKNKARKGLNPRNLAPVKVQAGKTVRFKASPVLKKSV